ncbi:TIGR03747 family integrating conjugative element membrane protein [Neopusillimonas aromaticivorans]|uniref:TIGR03747 family integrating conjugative element membrane protein n=1 Tax=Neopusillimonas aromaticivorans TaxID=2979868 RepID=UPI0025981F31|nr:TIGR03747 family integrating conjugative element membrane protein [Neopusillimonas aromaticivorans]WJJ93310.1 TIGR03747 family integrating conjugative element membrane protein [Neopusillimonas aromaticivorans]
MSNQPATQASPPRRPGLIARLLLSPLHLFGLLCGALLLALTLQGIGMMLFWPEHSWRHADTLAQQELARIPTAFPRSLVFPDPAHTAQRLDDTLQYWLLQRSGLHTRLTKKTADIHKPPTDIHNPAARLYTQHGFKQHLNQARHWLTNATLAAAHAARVFALRLFALSLCLPLFLATAMLGLVDGLVRRDQRRFGAGQESGFIYHRAKASLGPLLVWPWLLWLALPVSLPTLAFMLPAAVLQGIALSLTASRFKKSL